MFNSYVAFMVAWTIGALVLPLIIVALEPVESLHSALASESFARWGYVAVGIVSVVVAYGYVTAVYVIDDAGIRKIHLHALWVWEVPRGNIAHVAVEDGVFNSHLILTLRDQRTKALVMTRSMKRDLDDKLGTTSK